jgi:hypothetical protein
MHTIYTKIAAKVKNKNTYKLGPKRIIGKNLCY